MRAEKVTELVQCFSFDFSAEDLGEGAEGTYKTPIKIPVGAVIGEIILNVKTAITPQVTNTGIAITDSDSTYINTFTGTTIAVGVYAKSIASALNPPWGGDGWVYLTIPATNDIAAGTGTISISYLIGA